MSAPLFSELPPPPPVPIPWMSCNCPVAAIPSICWYWLPHSPSARCRHLRSASTLLGSAAPSWPRSTPSRRCGSAKRSTRKRESGPYTARPSEHPYDLARKGSKRPLLSAQPLGMVTWGQTDHRRPAGTSHCVLIVSYGLRTRVISYFETGKSAVVVPVALYGMSVCRRVVGEDAVGAVSGLGVCRRVAACVSLCACGLWWHSAQFGELDFGRSVTVSGGLSMYCTHILFPSTLTARQVTDAFSLTLLHWL